MGAMELRNEDKNPQCQVLNLATRVEAEVRCELHCRGRKVKRTAMKVTLFLGSGISYESRLPKVEEITNRILNDKWQGFSEGQELLRMLKSKADAYLTRWHAESIEGRKGTFPDQEIQEDDCLQNSNYEDLYYLVQQIANEEDHEIENAAIEPFVLSLRREIEQKYSVVPSMGDPTQLATIARQATCLIKSAVTCLLSTKADPKGFNLILDLAKRADITLDIFTLNHDLLIERLLKKIAPADGFDPHDGDVRWFNHGSYQDDTKRVRLYKLHGSLDWWRLSSATNPLVGLAALDDPSAIGWRSAHGDLFGKVDSLPEFLAGSYNKMDMYRYGIYAHLHNAFAATLREQDVIVMSGYGWNDRGINGWLREWLSDQRKRIVLLDEKPDELVKSRSFLWHSYLDLIKRGQLDVRIRKYLKDVGIDELLPHLHSRGDMRIGENETHGRA
jgi:hypothetical protein